MSTQRIDLSNLKPEMIVTSFATEHPVQEEPAAENKQAAPDEFEIRRRAFFAA